MKITEKQLLEIINILYDSIDGDFENSSSASRRQLYNQILQQQSGDIVDVIGSNNPTEEKV
jgi:hypothetical protein